jgi:putative acetyltransferase
VGAAEEAVTVPARIEQARSEQDWEDVGRLVREYVAGLPFVLDFQDVDAELAEADEHYTPPDGAALLARDGDGAGVAFVGVRRFDERDGELKRMYVVPAARGGGLARALAVRAIEAARGAGYERLLLDTVASLAAAIALYEDLGWMEIGPYRHNPRPDARYFALHLS